jgi:hypothetical protein
LIAKFAKTRPSFVLFGMLSSLIAAPAFAGGYRPGVISDHAPPAIFAAAQRVQQHAFSVAATAAGSRLGPLAHSAATPSPLSTTDWIAQLVTGVDADLYDSYGSAVAMDGNTIFIGSSQALGEYTRGPGKVFVYEYSATGWTLAQTLTPSDGETGDGFGSAIAVQGDTAIISAINAQVGDNELQGAVYVFKKVAGAWTETQRLSPPDGTARRFLGLSVALHGDYALVGTPGGFGGDDVMLNPVFVMQNIAGLWKFVDTLYASDYVPGDMFGYDVAIHGNRALIGAIGATINGEMAQGAAYVFDLVDGEWTETHKLTHADGSGLEVFGWSVAIQDDVAVVGAPWKNRNNVQNVGAAYTFTLEGGVWSQTQKLTPIASDASTGFGYNVKLNGDYLLSSTGWGLYTEGVRSNGGGWLYKASADEGYALDAMFYALDTDLANFGSTGAVSSSTVVLGAPGYNYYTGYSIIHTRDSIFQHDFESAAR